MKEERIILINKYIWESMVEGKLRLVFLDISFYNKSGKYFFIEENTNEFLGTAFIGKKFILKPKINETKNHFNIKWKNNNKEYHFFSKTVAYYVNNKFVKSNKDFLVKNVSEIKDFSNEENLNPKEFSNEMIKKIEEITSCEHYYTNDNNDCFFINNTKKGITEIWIIGIYENDLIFNNHLIDKKGEMFNTNEEYKSFKIKEIKSVFFP